MDKVNHNIQATIKIKLLSGEIITKQDIFYLTTNLAEYIRLIIKRLSVSCPMVYNEHGKKFGLYFVPSVVKYSKLKQYLNKRKLKLESEL
jgi:hypothetical protein